MNGAYSEQFSKKSVAYFTSNHILTLFVSCFNHKTSKYTSWSPCRNSVVIHAFSITCAIIWENIQNQKGNGVWDRDYSLMGASIYVPSNDCTSKRFYNTIGTVKYFDFAIQGQC